MKNFPFHRFFTSPYIGVFPPYFFPDLPITHIFAPHPLIQGGGQKNLQYTPEINKDEQYCPMFIGTGNLWLQEGKESRSLKYS